MNIILSNSEKKESSKINTRKWSRQTFITNQMRNFGTITIYHKCDSFVIQFSVFYVFLLNFDIRLQSFFHTLTHQNDKSWMTVLALDKNFIIKSYICLLATARRLLKFIGDKIVLFTEGRLCQFYIGVLSLNKISVLYFNICVEIFR